MSVHLDELFAAMQPPTDDGGERSYSVQQIPDCPVGRYLGVDRNGNPCLLIQTTNVRHIPPTRLENIEVLYSTECRITSLGGVHQDRFTIVCCNSNDRTLISYFLATGGILLGRLPFAPTVSDVAQVVDRLVALFRKLSHPPTRPLYGLVGELLMIRWASAPHVALTAWRSEDEERFDFSYETLRIEVKVAAGRQRIHHFSIEQCQPASGTVGLLASLFVERSGGGVSLAEIIRSIEASLRGERELILRLRETVAGTLGNNYSSALGERFDEELAASSLRLFWLGDIPAVRGPLAPEISQVRFSSDLSNVRSVSSRDVLKMVPQADWLLRWQ